MASLHLICVGKLKDKNLEAIEADYKKRIKNPKLQIHEVKAKAENKDSEATEVLRKCQQISKNPYIVILTEFGKEYDSPQFSKWLYNGLESGKDIILVICGAEGPGDELKESSHAKVSLSKLTYPHKLARILLIEQLYRAQTIFEGHPYHN